MNTIRKTWLGAGLAVTLAIGGCWGDSDEGPVVVVPPPVVVPPVPPPVVVAEVPGSAAASIGAFVAYLVSLSSSDETSEPLVLRDTFVVPLDESSEPQLLI